MMQMKHIAQIQSFMRQSTKKHSEHVDLIVTIIILRSYARYSRKGG